MGQVPCSREWDTSSLPECRRAYLESGRSFEEIVSSLVEETEVRRAWIEPYRTHPKGTPKETRQVCFRLRICAPTYDLFYNSPDGLRGRYWQRPDLGDHATHHLITCLRPKFLKFAGDNPPEIIHPAGTMKIEEIQASLDASSAKVWVREKDDDGNSKIDSTSGPQLKVLRWMQNENKPCSKGPLWRWTPIDNEIEIKGALLTPEGDEKIPEGKQNRSCQIHQFGFT